MYSIAALPRVDKRANMYNHCLEQKCLHIAIAIVTNPAQRGTAQHGTAPAQRGRAYEAARVHNRELAQLRALAHAAAPSDGLAAGEVRPAAARSP